MPAVWGFNGGDLALSSGWHARQRQNSEKKFGGNKESGEKRLQHRPTLPTSPANLDAYSSPSTARLIFGCRHITHHSYTTRVFLDANHGRHTAMSPILTDDSLSVVPVPTAPSGQIAIRYSLLASRQR